MPGHGRKVECFTPELWKTGFSPRDFLDFGASGRAWFTAGGTGILRNHKETEPCFRDFRRPFSLTRVSGFQQRKRALKSIVCKLQNRELFFSGLRAPGLYRRRHARRPCFAGGVAFIEMRLFQIWNEQILMSRVGGNLPCSMDSKQTVPFSANWVLPWGKFTL